MNLSEPARQAPYADRRVGAWLQVPSWELWDEADYCLDAPELLPAGGAFTAGDGRGYAMCGVRA
jgi:hypothetical protein